MSAKTCEFIDPEVMELVDKINAICHYAAPSMWIHILETLKQLARKRALSSGLKEHDALRVITTPVSFATTVKRHDRCSKQATEENSNLSALLSENGTVTDLNNLSVHAPGTLAIVCSMYRVSSLSREAEKGNSYLDSSYDDKARGNDHRDNNHNEDDEAE